MREHSLMKVPYIIAVGGREAEAGTVALRRLGSNDQQVFAVDAAIELIKQDSLPPDLAEKTGVRAKNHGQIT